VNLAKSVLSTSWVFRAMSAYANNVQGKGRVLQVARVTKCSGDDTHTHTHSLAICYCLLSHLRVKVPHKAVFFSFFQDNYVVVPQDKTVRPLAGPLLPKRYLLGRQMLL